MYRAIYKSRESGITEAMLDQSSTKMDIKSTSPITVGFEPPSAPKNKNTGALPLDCWHCNINAKYNITTVLCSHFIDRSSSSIINRRLLTCLNAMYFILKV